MTLASDQKTGPEDLSENSRRMLALRETVLTEWERRTRAAAQEAQELRVPVIIDTIPTFYDNLAEALTPGYPRTNATSSTNLAAKHGSERARLTNYDPKVLILEYQIFRSVLLTTLVRNGIALSLREMEVINSSIDEAIREAVSSFTLAVGALREQFVAALTHDMRGPLGTASMAAELISLTAESSKIKELAQRIYENVYRVDTMVQSLLDTMLFQQGERLKLRLSHFNILELAKEVCQDSLQLGSRCQIIGGAVHGWWDREAMKRVLENLTGNALKYGSTDKPIRIKIDSFHERLMLSVHNEGQPVPVEEQQAIFQMFIRTKDAEEGGQQGWGIGLPYVRIVVESHGGSVVIDSTAERGTTFSLDVPVDARPFHDAPTLGKTS